MTEEKNIDSTPSIDNPLYKRFAKVFSYAMDKTQNELEQAVEGMYHNLNTLN
jgi:ribonucleoside-triphosphate reductase